MGIQAISSQLRELRQNGCLPELNYQEEFQGQPLGSLNTPVNLVLAEKFQSLLVPSRFKIFYGGRGAGKSQSFAMVLTAFAHEQGILVLCCRETQNSIEDSVHREVAAAIELLGLQDYFEILHNSIRHRFNGSEFIFKGLRNNNALKSIKGLKYVWVEEAQSVTEDSWLILQPTMRVEGSEIWVSFNPNDPEDPTYKRFVINPPPGIIPVKVNWYDNPWFPEVLEIDRLVDLERDKDVYDWVWNGNVRKNSAATVFRDRIKVENFDTPDTDQNGNPTRFYHGVDWGFARDPSVMIRCWIRTSSLGYGEDLMVDMEAYGVGVELNELENLFDEIPTSRMWPIKADNSRPETISFMKGHRFPISAAEKWPGSVEDGIAHLKNFTQIVVHRDKCPHTAQEFRLYSYKVDRNNKDILPIIVDKWNHCIAEGELIKTARGEIPIQDVCVGDMAWTRMGYHRVYSAGKTSDDREIWELRAGGKVLRATSDHEVYTANRGLVRMDALRYTDEVFISGGLPLQNQESFDLNASNTTITPLTTLNAFPDVSMMPNMLRNDGGIMKPNFSTSHKSVTKLKRGTLQMKGEPNIVGLARLLTSIFNQSLNLVSNVRNYFPHESSEIKTGSVLTDANLRLEESLELMMKTEHARSVELSFDATNMRDRGFVLAPVQTVRDTGEWGPVYDLSVENYPEFIASGIAVANCIDALRYSQDGLIIRSRGLGSWAYHVEDQIKDR